MHLLDANVGTKRPLAPGAPVELFFDRLLMPVTVTRQSFVFTDLVGNGVTPRVAYDPVARAVTLYPLIPLDPCQTYRVALVQPGDAADTNGLRAIDGAPLDPSTAPFLEFAVKGTCATGGDAGDGGIPPSGTVAAPPSVDFCATILPMLQLRCTTGGCHSATSPAEGLSLASEQQILDTAIGRVAQEANQGARANVSASSTRFGLDMPLVDRGGTASSGAPADSWLLYKLLLATPSPCSLSLDGGTCDASAATVQNNLHSRPWHDMGDAERATLGQYVTGSPMPFPTFVPGASGALSLDELEQVSFWIAEGAPVVRCAP